MVEFVVIIITMCGVQIDATLYSTKDYRYWEHVNQEEVIEIIGKDTQFKVIKINPQLKLNTDGIYCT